MVKVWELPRGYQLKLSTESINGGMKGMRGRRTAALHGHPKLSSIFSDHPPTAAYQQHAPADFIL